MDKITAHAAAPEQGQKLLEDGVFDEAIACFRQVIASDPDCPQAYWGILSAEHQCRSDRELIDLGVCLDRDPMYAAALSHADEATRARFAAVAGQCLVRSHFLLLAQVEAGQYLRASLRAADYARSAYADPRLTRAHALLVRRDALSGDPIAERVRILTELAGIHCEDGPYRRPDGDGADFAARLCSDAIESLPKKALEAHPADLPPDVPKPLLEEHPTSGEAVYRNTLSEMNYRIKKEERDRKKEEILRKARIRLIGEYADLYALPGGTAPTGAAATGGILHVGERYLAFLEALLADSDTVTYYEYSPIIHQVLGRAKEHGASPEHYAAFKREYRRRVMEHRAGPRGYSPLEMIRTLIADDPEDPVTRFRAVELIFSSGGDPDRAENCEHREMEKADAFLKETQSYYWYKGNDIETALLPLIERRRALPDEIRHQAQEHYLASLKNAGENRAEYTQKWDARNAELARKCTEKARELEEKLSAVREHRDRLQERWTAYVEKESRRTKAASIRLSVLTLVLLALTAAGAIYALVFPQSTAPVPTAAECLAAGALITGVQFLLWKRTKKYRLFPDPLRIGYLICGILTGLAALAVPVLILINGLA